MTDASLQGAVFDTPLGVCGLVWGDAGIVGACLPEADANAAWRRLEHSHGPIGRAPLPVSLKPVAGGIASLMDGGEADLSRAPLDMAAIADFDRRVYDVCRSIPRGRALTYGDVAFRLGDVALSRAVGVSLGKNPFPPIVPCHRVMGADGRMVGFSATGGIALKRRLLALEGAIEDQPDLFG